MRFFFQLYVAVFFVKFFVVRNALSCNSFELFLFE